MYGFQTSIMFCLTRDHERICLRSIARSVRKRMKIAGKKMRNLWRIIPISFIPHFKRLLISARKRLLHGTIILRSRRKSFFRNLSYFPVLLIKDNLYELEYINRGPRLKKVERAHLIFNYHFKQTCKTAIIHIVTQRDLLDFLNEVLAAERQVEENMLTSKKRIQEKN